MTSCLPSFKVRSIYRISILVILLLAFALRLWALDARSIWFDEAFEYWAATSALADIPETVRIVLNDPPLYTFVLHFWLKVGRDVFIQRYLSVIVSMLGVAGMILIGQRVSGKRTALISALLLAVLPSQVRYAQDSGQYIWMSSLLVWNLFALLWINQTDRRRAYLCWIGTALAASYLYYGAVFTVIVSAALAFWEWLQRKDWLRVRRGVLAVGIYAVGILPLVFYFLPTQLFRGPTANAFVLNPQPFSDELRTALTMTAHLIAFQFTGWPWTGVPLWLTSIVIWPLLGLALYKRTSPTGRRVVVWLLCIWIAYYALSYIRIYPYSYRYGLILTPLLVPVVALGLENLGALPHLRRMQAVAFVTILGICLISLPNRPLRDLLFPNPNWPWPETAEMEPVAQHWINNRGPDTPTYVYYGAIPAFRFYLNLLGYESESPPPTWIQSCFSRQPERATYCNKGNIYYGRWSRNLPADYRTQEVHDFMAANGDKLWVVIAHVYGNEHESLLESLSPDYAVIQSYEDVGAGIHLLQRRQDD